MEPIPVRRDEISPAESAPPGQASPSTSGNANAPTPENRLEHSEGRTISQCQDDAEKARVISIGQGEFHWSVAGYTPLRKLGRGTFGEVWLAEQEFAGPSTADARILVAIKFFPGRDRTQLQRMLDEAKILTRLRSDPRIVYLIDHNAAALPPYFVMDYMERGSLADELVDSKPMPLGQALRVFREIVEAMTFVHAKGIRHCDLKPGNILINADGKPKIADFGQAHLSIEPGALALGTFFYMAPDQANIEHNVPDSRWDVYGLGALFFAMITGRPPRYNRELSHELAGTASMSKKLKRYQDSVMQAPSPTEHRRVHGMDRQLAAIIDRCICVDPTKRLRDAGEILDALDQRERDKRRRPFLTFGILVSLLMMTALAIFGYVALGKAQTDLENRVLNSNLITADLVAEVIPNILQYEMKRLDGWARGEKVGAYFSAFHQEPTDAARTKKREELEKYLETLGKNSRFNSLFILDNDGRLLAATLRNPDSKGDVFRDIRGKSFQWRAYWNRTNDQHDQKDKHHGYKPNKVGGHADAPFIGPPYEGMTKFMHITISTPLYHSKAPTAKVGLLVGTILLSDLHGWIDPIEKEGGCAVVIDQHGYCLHHQRKHRKALEPESNKAPKIKDFALKSSWRQRRDHVDPYSGASCLAVHVPIDELGWHVIVQHERDQVLRDIDTIRLDLLVTLLSGVLSTAVILLGLWGLFRWLERRKEPVVTPV